MDSLFLSGNEAVARGAWEAGAKVGVAYPGTPSTETLENLVTYDGVTCQWAPNEKVALEVALGVSYAGARVLFTCKHVGVNVAADPLFTAAYSGVLGGLVMLVADDPSMHSSQNEQDSHNYAAFSKVPMLDPADPTEAREFTKLAFELSEEFKTPVFVRTTTRVAHSKELVEIAERKERENIAMVRDFRTWVMMPAMARAARIVLDDKINRLRDYSEDSDLNSVEHGNRQLGLLCSGVVYHFVKEAYPDASIFKVGMSYPLPKEKIRAFADSVERFIVVEEADDYFARSIRSFGIPCEELSIPRRGELTPELIKCGVGDGTIPSMDAIDNLPPRPPLLCAGCPHRLVFYMLGKLGCLVTGDIGCYTLGAAPPLAAMDTCICMGASIPMAHGVELALGSEAPKAVAVIGDSTFAHSGITGLVNSVYNAGTSTIAILDNRITAMTGHQGNPVNGIGLDGNLNPELELETLCKAMGVAHVVTVDANDLVAVGDVLNSELEFDGLSVIIFRSPCILLTKEMGPTTNISHEKCRGCRVCSTIGCPAIIFDAATKKASIDKENCRGCGQCKQVCKFSAIAEVGGK